MADTTMSEFNPKKLCQLLEIPAEVRLRIYKEIIPFRERIHMDPKNVVPLLFGEADMYDDLRNLLTLCKQVHKEAIPLLYSNCIVTFNSPKKHPDMLAALGARAYRNIVRLDVSVTTGFVDCARFWRTMNDDCPSLKKLRLIFYHDRHHNWLPAIADYVLAKQNDLTWKTKLEFEFFDSIWATPCGTESYTARIKENLFAAENRSVMYTFELPRKLETLAVSASVFSTAASAFESYPVGGGWAWKRDTSKDKGVMKFLEFGRTSEITV